MHDRPTVEELIAAVRLYLERDLQPALSDSRLRFQTLIAINVLSVVEREMRHAEEHLSAEWEALSGLLRMTGPIPSTPAELKAAVRRNEEVLCTRIHRGDFDSPERFAKLSKLLSRLVAQKLQVANPRYLGSFQSI